MNKSRPAPPGVLRTHRNIDPPPFNPNPAATIFSSAPAVSAPTAVDQLANLGTSLANLNLTAAPQQTSNSFNLPGK